MKQMKKIMALVLALAMVFALSVTAFADDAENGNTATDGIAGNTSGVWASKDTPVAQGNAVILYKEITAYNPEESTVNAPTITYTYNVSTVTVAENTTEIYDAKDNHNPAANAHVFVKSGVGTPSVTTSLDLSSYSNGTDANKLQITPAVTMTANTTGYANKYGIKVTFDPADFTAAGVYRYQITESANRYENSGVVDGDISNIRYLDVYVKDAATEGQYEIYGYVCFQNNNSIDARDDATSNTVTAAAKTEGFVATTNGGADGATTQTADQYYTYNVTVQKTLSGDQAMNSHKFPFKVVFANTTVVDNVLPIVTEVTNGKATIPVNYVVGDTNRIANNINTIYFDGTTPNSDTDQGKKLLAISNGGQVKITGIPAGTRVTISEYNDVIGTVYTTTTTGATINEVAGITLNWNTWADDVDNWADKEDGTGTVYAMTKTENTNEKADSNFTVVFTNTLLTISPTGYVVRIAPYVLMLAGGVALLIVTRRRREDSQAA